MLIRMAGGRKLFLLMKVHSYLINLNMDEHPESKEYPKKATVIVKKYKFGGHIINTEEV